MKPAVHMVHIVLHVYLYENPPSPNKVKCTHLDCIKSRQTRERTKPEDDLFILVSGSRQ